MVSDEIRPKSAPSDRTRGGLQAIARELDLSVSLVSKVLNNRLGTSGASPETFRLIREQAKRMGYRKNQSAAALVSGKQNVVGVFVHSIGTSGSGLPLSIVQGVSDRASFYDQRLWLQFFDQTNEFERHRRWLHPSVMDGVILAGFQHRELRQDLIEIQNAGVSVVTVYDEQLDPAIINSGPNQVEVGRVATAHLIERGCRRIAQIQVTEFTHRNEGYQKALHQAGLSPDPRLVFDTSDYGCEFGSKAVEHFLRSGIEFDGLFAHSDELAIGAMHALLRAGRRVPEDVKIIGVDDSPMCACTMVPLSSVSQELRICGQQAMDLLNRMIGGEPCQSITAPPVLRARQSSLG